jgi:hypothetical protein
VTKVFAATYLNMAIVALVAYGYIRRKPTLAKEVFPNNTDEINPPQAQLFNGDFSDFDSSWYAQVSPFACELDNR